MNSIENIITALNQFREERDWKQFHNPKDLALALSIEASELNELFLWKQAHAADKTKVAKELADVISYALLLAQEYDLDIETIVLDKIKENAIKYPIEKARGTAKKYTDL